MSENSSKFIMDRKQFIRNSGIALAGVTLLGSMGSLIIGCDNDAESSAPENTAEENGAANGNGISVAAVAWPVAFPKMDPDQAAQIAYDSYKAGYG
jgi:hypothetical protein